jgi:hypothetical protein
MLWVTRERSKIDRLVCERGLGERHGWYPGQLPAMQPPT